MSRLAGFYSPRYAVPGVTPYARLADAAERLHRLGLVDFREPAPIDPARLTGLHDAAYLDAFLRGSEPLASSQGLPWSAAVRDATLCMLGGQLEAVEHALAHGLAFNLARGFHHAVPQRGSGNCALNGFALIAHLRPGLRVMVVDCDEHGGNGTEEFAARLPNLYAVSIFGTRFGCQGGVRSWACHVTREQGYAEYRRALDQAAALVDEHRPELLVYQAGADCHRNDPKSQLKLSTHEMFERDLQAFRLARQRRLPMLFVVAGGYQTAERVARLNANTVRAARIAWTGAAAR